VPVVQAFLVKSSFLPDINVMIIIMKRIGNGCQSKKVLWFVWALVFMLCTQCLAVAARRRARPRPKPRQIVRRGSTSPSSFTPEMSFRQAIYILRNATSPPVNIVVLWKDLAGNADIDPTTSIGMDGVSGVSMRTHLELLLQAVAGGGPRLGYVVRGNSIVIGTQDNLPERQIARIYDIRDIVQSPSLGFNPFARRLPMPFPTIPPTAPSTATANAPAANRQ